MGEPRSGVQDSLSLVKRHPKLNSNQRYPTVNPAFSNESFEHSVFVGIEEAEEMYPILADGFEAAEGEETSRTRGAYKTR